MKTSNFFKFGSRNAGFDDISREEAPKIVKSFGVNKIYRNKEANKKYFIPYRASEKQMKGSTFDSKKCLQTSSQFKISRKKREGSTYLKNI